jgi:hypothetical protein
VPEESQQSEPVAPEPILERSLEHDVALIVGTAVATTVANEGLGPMIHAGVEKLQSVFQHDPPPPIELPPGVERES